MLSFTVTIIDPLGLHARPASKIAQISSKFSSDIKIINLTKPGTANAKSIMNIMSLGVKTGSQITIEISGDDEQQALDAIKASMIENNLI
ncbi:HPr family phosphocarrier protein [[Mycoplasma] collis]|uniref:HPr family phosphocarrier protein n=1 Tax=[Mycoplasma] collis TaxID=2127 RepID=UPI00051BB56E|nr:HPr family phosphocarrier protein [[Mycoplasma] collis]